MASGNHPSSQRSHRQDEIEALFNAPGRIRQPLFFYGTLMRPSTITILTGEEDPVLFRDAWLVSDDDRKWEMRMVSDHFPALVQWTSASDAGGGGDDSGAAPPSTAVAPAWVPSAPLQPRPEAEVTRVLARHGVVHGRVWYASSAEALRCLLAYEGGYFMYHPELADAHVGCSEESYGVVRDALLFVWHSRGGEDDTLEVAEPMKVFRRYQACETSEETSIIRSPGDDGVVDGE